MWARAWGERGFKGFMCPQRVYVSPKGSCVPKGFLCPQKVYVSAKSLCVHKGFMCLQRVYVSTKGLCVPKGFMCPQRVYVSAKGLCVHKGFMCLLWTHAAAHLRPPSPQVQRRTHDAHSCHIALTQPSWPGVALHAAPLPYTALVPPTA